MTQSILPILHNSLGSKSFPLSRQALAARLGDDRPMPKKALSTDSAIDVLDFAVRMVEAGYRVALCTLVEIRGGSSRPLGAHMAVADDGRYCGYVSGGCTEAAIAAEALEAFASGHDRFVMLGEGSPFFDIILPCGGGITVAIHMLRDIEPICSVVTRMRNRQEASLSYASGNEQLSFGANGPHTGWDGDVFVTCYRPAVRVLLSGRTLEVEVAAQVAEAAGYEVVLYDQAKVGDPDPSMIDADTAVALLQHDIELEMPVLNAALNANPFYIGALGSSRTHERRVERLREIGHSSDVIGRIKAPIGLFGRARDAHSLALSVIADIAACRQSTLTSA